METFMLSEEFSFYQQLTGDESIPFGKGLEQKDLRQTETMKMENIFPNYKKEKNSNLMFKEWDRPINQMLKKIQKA